MTIDSYLRSAEALLASMAILALVETRIPLARQPGLRRRHMLPNLVLIGLTLGLNFAFNAGAVLAAAWFGARGFGLVAESSLSPLALLLFGVVVLDASTFACHWLMHRLPLLWRAHRVHHSDALVDVTTTLRQHPIEGAWRFLFVIVPSLALGIPAEAVAIYRVISAVQGLFEHMNVKLWEPLDRALSLVICTPNMHKLHHSRRQLETDSNYGNLLSFFDRRCGTFRPFAPGCRVTYGLEGCDSAASQQLGSLLRLPFRDSLCEHIPAVESGALERAGS